jgi:hypothetical protein
LTSQGLTVAASYGYFVSEFLCEFRNPN